MLNSPVKPNLDSSDVKKWIQKYWRIIKKTFWEFISDNPMNYSSSIAFYLIFSLPAILLITVSIAESFYEDQVVRQNLLEQISMLLGQESASTVDKILKNASVTGSSVTAKIVGISMLLLSATTVFLSLQDGLNSIWKIKPKPNYDIWNFIKNRLLSLAMIVTIGFLLLVSLVVDTLIAVFNSLLTTFLSEGSLYIVSALNVMISIAIITLVFAMIFKILPDAKIGWHDVWIGAFVTTLLFTAGKYLIGFYLGSSSVDSVYGAAGSLVLLLIWVYYSSVIVFVGAEFTYVYSQEIGHKIKPNKYAVVVDEVEKENSVANE